MIKKNLWKLVSAYKFCATVSYLGIWWKNLSQITQVPKAVIQLEESK